MPYKVSGKGDALGCSGYAVQTETGKIVGCHATRADADAHLQALYANVEDASKSEVAGATPSFTVDPRYPGAGIRRPQQGRAGRGTTGSSIRSQYGKKPKNTRRGRNSDNNPSSGALGTVDGTSLGGI
jgi:hypothetical protein